MTAPPNYSRYTLWLLPLAVSLLVFFTSNWYAPGDPTMSVGSDSYSYIEIAEAYPGLPDYFEHLDREKGIYHHNQRFVFPWLVGALSSVTGVGVTITFRVVSLFLILLFSFLFVILCDNLNVDERGCYIGLFVVAFNPYTFRLYAAFPYMVPDVAFLVSVVVVLLGLTEKRLSLVLGGTLASIAARQTALVLLPGLAVWVLLVPGWRRQSLWLRWSAVFGSGGLLVGGYLFTGSIAASVSQPSYNVEHILGLYYAIKGGMSLREAFVFAARFLITFGVLIACTVPLCSRRSIRKLMNEPQLWALGLMGLGIVAQPVLAGPGGNAQRLSALALPLLVLLGMKVVTEWRHVGRVWIFAYGVVVFISSLHHVTSIVGPRHSLREEFVLMSLAVIMITALVSLSARYTDLFKLTYEKRG